MLDPVKDGKEKNQKAYLNKPKADVYLSYFHEEQPQKGHPQTYTYSNKRSVSLFFIRRRLRFCFICSLAVISFRLTFTTSYLV